MTVEAFDLASWVKASTRQSGVSEKVTDQAVLIEVAAKLNKGRDLNGENLRVPKVREEVRDVVDVRKPRLLVRQEVVR